MPVVVFLPPTSADTVLTLEQLTLCGVVVLVVVVDVCYCDSGGCSYGDMIATCTAGWR